MDPSADRRPAARANVRIGLVLGGVALGMVGLAFAAVPLYRVFCQVTGYGGTPQVAADGADAGASAAVPADAPPITVRFDANVNPELPWRFRPNDRAVTVSLGEQALSSYHAVNTADRAITGTATFNVTPAKVARYFTKVDCFCFTRQRLEPGQAVDMPVLFYIDPALLDDVRARDVRTITLSYTFYGAT
ncbi:cytochrome c oxidase assembly protein [Roseospira goensis]|uniref:Cytochrome c oxidase assembly protein CtaG n=1 Tax=Roseospira goensis TaxID=391922 RepID=A0A7W6WL92_9PROT|nr:cytochrome c oxidase assembly protein [Roseospira goensis]MBB4287176.1 cytochrome c oxidase assembly protein subunit 11 [Roseospira goensis]